MTPTQRLKAMADDTDLSEEERAACAIGAKVAKAASEGPKVYVGGDYPTVVVLGDWVIGIRLDVNGLPYIAWRPQERVYAAAAALVAATEGGSK